MEAFGFAIEDATKAIELNPGYVKVYRPGSAALCSAYTTLIIQAYYRRAISNMAIMKSKEALKDFRTVARKG